MLCTNIKLCFSVYICRSFSSDMFCMYERSRWFSYPKLKISYFELTILMLNSLVYSCSITVKIYLIYLLPFIHELNEFYTWVNKKCDFEYTYTFYNLPSIVIYVSATSRLSFKKKWLKRKNGISTLFFSHLLSIKNTSLRSPWFYFIIRFEHYLKWKRKYEPFVLSYISLTVKVNNKFIISNWSKKKITTLD